MGVTRSNIQKRSPGRKTRCQYSEVWACTECLRKTVRKPWFRAELRVLRDEIKEAVTPGVTLQTWLWDETPYRILGRGVCVFRKNSNCLLRKRLCRRRGSRKSNMRLLTVHAGEIWWGRALIIVTVGRWW